MTKFYNISLDQNFNGKLGYSGLCPVKMSNCIVNEFFKQRNILQLFGTVFANEAEIRLFEKVNVIDLILF